KSFLPACPCDPDFSKACDILRRAFLRAETVKSVEQARTPGLIHADEKIWRSHSAVRHRRQPCPVSLFFAEYAKTYIRQPLDQRDILAVNHRRVISDRHQARQGPASSLFR